MSRSKLAAVDTSAGQPALMLQLASSGVAGASAARLFLRLPLLLDDAVDLATPFPRCGLLPHLPLALDLLLLPDPAPLPAPPLPPAPPPLPDFGLGG